MKLVLACSRVLVAVAIIAGSAVAAQADRGGTEAAAINDAAHAGLSVATLAPFGPDQLNEPSSRGSNCAHPCSSTCAQPGGFGCCAPGILVDRLAEAAGMGTAGALFRAADSAVAGADVEALLEPPKILT